MAFLSFDEEMGYAPAGARRKRNLRDFFRDAVEEITGFWVEDEEEPEEELLPPPPPIDEYVPPPPEEYVPTPEEYIPQEYQDYPPQEYIPPPPEEGFGGLPPYGEEAQFNPFNRNPMDDAFGMQFNPDAELDPSQVEDRRWTPWEESPMDNPLGDRWLPGALFHEDEPPPPPPPPPPPQFQGPIDFSSPEPAAWTPEPLDEGTQSLMRFNLDQGLKGLPWANIPSDLQEQVGEAFVSAVPDFTAASRQHEEFLPLARQALNQPTTKFEEDRAKYGEMFDSELELHPELFGLKGRQYASMPDSPAKVALKNQLFVEYVGNAEEGLDFGNLGTAAGNLGLAGLEKFDKYINRPAKDALAAAVVPIASAGVLGAHEIGLGDVTDEELARAKQSLNILHPQESFQASKDTMGQASQYYGEMEGPQGMVASAVFETVNNPLSYIPAGSGAKLSEKLAQLGIDQAAIRIPVAITSNLLDQGGMRVVLNMNLASEALQRDYIPFLDANDPATAMIVPLLAATLGGSIEGAAATKMTGVTKAVAEHSDQMLAAINHGVDTASQLAGDTWAVALDTIKATYDNPAVAPELLNAAIQAATDVIVTGGKGLNELVAKTINGGILAARVAEEITAGAPGAAFDVLKAGVEGGTIAVDRGIQLFRDATNAVTDVVGNLPGEIGGLVRLGEDSIRSFQPTWGEAGSAPAIVAVPLAGAAIGAGLNYALDDEHNTGSLVAGAGAGAAIGLSALGVAAITGSNKDELRTLAAAAIRKGDNATLVGSQLSLGDQQLLKKQLLEAAITNIERSDASAELKAARLASLKATAGARGTIKGIVDPFVKTLINPLVNANQEVLQGFRDVLADVKVRNAMVALGGHIEKTAITDDDFGLSFIIKRMDAKMKADPALREAYALASENPEAYYLKFFGDPPRKLDSEDIGMLEQLRTLTTEHGNLAVENDILRAETVAKREAYYTRGFWDAVGKDGDSRIHGSRFFKETAGFQKAKEYDTKLAALLDPKSNLHLAPDYNPAVAVKFHIDEINNKIVAKKAHDLLRTYSWHDRSGGGPGVLLNRNDWELLSPAEQAQFIKTKNSFLTGSYADVEQSSMLTQASDEVRKKLTELRRTKRRASAYGAKEAAVAKQLDDIEGRILKTGEVINDVSATADARLTAQLQTLADAKAYMRTVFNESRMAERAYGQTQGRANTLGKAALDRWVPQRDAMIEELDLYEADLIAKQKEINRTVRKAGYKPGDPSVGFPTADELLAYNKMIADAVAVSKEADDAILDVYSGSEARIAQRQLAAREARDAAKEVAGADSTTAKRAQTAAVNEGVRAGKLSNSEQANKLLGKLDELNREYSSLMTQRENLGGILRGSNKPSKAANSQAPLLDRINSLLDDIEGPLDPATETRSGGIRDQIRGLREEMAHDENIVYVHKDIEPIFAAWGEGSLADSRGYKVFNTINQEARRSALGGMFDLYMLGATGKTALGMALPVIGNASPREGLQYFAAGMRAAFDKKYRTAMVLSKSEQLEKLIAGGMGFGEDNAALFDAVTNGKDMRSLMAGVLDMPEHGTTAAINKLTGKQVKNHLDFGARYDKMNGVMEDVQFQGWTNVIKLQWGEKFANDYMAKGIPEKEAYEKAAHAMNSIFGGKDFKMEGWSPDAQAALRVGLLAPNWALTRIDLFKDALNPMDLDSFGKKWAIQTAMSNVAVITAGVVAVNYAANDGDINWGQVSSSLRGAFNPLDPHFMEFRVGGQWVTPMNWEKDITRVLFGGIYATQAALGDDDASAKFKENYAAYLKARSGIGVRLATDVGRQVMTSEGAVDFTGQPMVKGRVNTFLGNTMDSATELALMETASVMPQFMSEILRFIPANWATPAALNDFAHLRGASTEGDTLGEKLSLGKTHPNAAIFNLLGIARVGNLTPLKEALADANRNPKGNPLIDPKHDSWDDLSSYEKKLIETAQNEDGTLRYPRVAKYREAFRDPGYTEAAKTIRADLEALESRFLKPRAEGERPVTVGELRDGWTNASNQLKGAGAATYGPDGSFKSTGNPADDLVNSWGSLYDKAKVNGVIDNVLLARLQAEWIDQHDAEWLRSSGLSKQMPSAKDGREFVETYFHMDKSDLRNDYYKATDLMAQKQGFSQEWLDEHKDFAQKLAKTNFDGFGASYFDMAQHLPIPMAGEKGLSDEESRNFTRESVMRSGKKYWEVENIYLGLRAEVSGKEAKQRQVEEDDTQGEAILKLALQKGYSLDLARDIAAFTKKANNPWVALYKEMYPGQWKWFSDDLDYAALKSFGAAR